MLFLHERTHVSPTLRPTTANAKCVTSCSRHRKNVLMKWWHAELATLMRLYTSVTRSWERQQLINRQFRSQQVLVTWRVDDDFVTVIWRSVERKGLRTTYKTLRFLQAAIFSQLLSKMSMMLWLYIKTRLNTLHFIAQPTRAHLVHCETFVGVRTRHFSKTTSQPQQLFIGKPLHYVTRHPFT